MEPKREDSKSLGLHTKSTTSLRSLGLNVEFVKSNAEDSFVTIESLTQSGFSPENGAPVGQNTYDIIAYIIHCEKHDRIAVNKTEKACWLPFIAFNMNRSFQDSADEGIQLVLSRGNENLPQVKKISAVNLQLSRLQLPHTLKFITRLLYFFKIDKELIKSEFKCCQGTKTIKWVHIEDIKNGTIENIWGPELIQAAKYAADNKTPDLPKGLVEQSAKYVLSLIPRDPPRNIEEAMLKALSISEKEIDSVFMDFIEHCFPSFFMTFTSFTDYMSKIKIGSMKVDVKLFNAFNYKYNGFLNFQEFLMGIACYEMNSVHDESRVKFIFRYYDLDSDGTLGIDEMIKLIVDMNPDENEKKIVEKTKEAMRIIGTEETKVPFKKFVEAVGAKKLRGTSVLVRSKVPIFSQIAGKREGELPFYKSGSKRILSKNIYKGSCPGCKVKKYKLASNVVGISNDVRLIGTMGFTMSFDSEEMQEPTRKHSNEVVFNYNSKGQHIAFHTFNMINRFNSIKGAVQNPLGLGSLEREREKFHSIVSDLCSQVERIFMDEERVVKVSSPCFVLGDLHGNLEDLLTFERMLWPLFPLVKTNLIFLGNYIDRGKWGVECVLYLFCLKIICPNQFFFCRGNHEIRDVNGQLTFQQECLAKYGSNYGSQIYEMINRVFDSLPLACVLDETVFCVDGGIPMSTTTIEEINKIPVELSAPETQSPIAWEVNDLSMLFY